MSAEIGVIAPDEELYSLLEEIRHELPEPILLRMGFLNVGVECAQELKDKGIKVIVSRGGTTTKIRSTSLPFPVIDIPITEYDVICLLNQAKKISDRIAVIGFDPLVYGAKMVGPILNLNISTYLVQTENDVQAAVKNAAESGIPVVIGAKLAVECSKNLGLTGIMLRSQKQVVIGALYEAIKLLNAIKREREWGERLRTVFDSIQEGIVSVDSEGKAIQYNKIAEKVFGASLKSIPLAESGIFNAIKKREKWIGEIKEFNNVKYVCNLNPIIINEQFLGATIVFQEVKQLEKIEQKVRRNLYQKGLTAQSHFEDIVHQNISMDKLISRARKYAQTEITVLIEGESGTGKEIFAQSIHNASTKRSGPFVAINCAVLPENLLESELFGYVDGAFTGARRGGKIGLLEVAHKGTLFLDEIGEASLSVQARLLRVLEERKIMRIGDDKVIPVDVRIICATNRELRQHIKNKKFREDLFYRINVLKLDIPPLRNRPEDIPVLARNFLRQIGMWANNQNEMVLTDEAADILTAHDYPGNIRELRNIIERLCVSSSDKYITAKAVLECIDFPQKHETQIKPRLFAGNDKSMVRQEELKLILKVLKDSDGNKALAARKLGISKSTLWRKLKEID